MALIVQKFGGSSVADANRVRNVANRVVETANAGNKVVVVVSAQGDTTDDLIEKAMEINPNASKREMDMLLSSGEQISIALLAMAIQKIGHPVVSLTGWQAGFRSNAAHSNARISRIDTDTMILPPLAGAEATPRRLRLRRLCTRTSARYTPMLTAYIRLTRELLRTRKSSAKSRMTRCLNLQVSAQTSCITGRSKWRKSIMFRWK